MAIKTTWETDLQRFDFTAFYLHNRFEVTQKILNSQTIQKSKEKFSALMRKKDPYGSEKGTKRWKQEVET